MIRVARRIWKHWSQVEPLGRPAVELLFVSKLDLESAEGAVLRAAASTIRELEQRPPHAAGEEFSTGACMITVVPDGIALRIDEEPEDFEALLRGIADRLEREGVGGTFDLLEPDLATRLPEYVAFLECRLRVDGTQTRFQGGNLGWRAADAALARGIDAAAEWCTADEPSALALSVRLLAPVSISGAEEARSYLRRTASDVSEVGVVRVTAVGAAGFRIAAVEPWSGRISLIQGGEWRPALTSLERAATAAASWAAYAFIKCGSRRLDAELGQLYMDWVPIHLHNSLSARAHAFEDRYAPDSFGVQLLGRGYSGRVPAGVDWKADVVDESAVLLRHRDAAAWFDGRLVPFGGHPLKELLEGAVPVPELVAKARELFASILFTDKIARDSSMSFLR